MALQSGYFRVLSYNPETGDLELSEHDLEDPAAEIVYCEWSGFIDHDKQYGRIFFREQWLNVPDLSFSMWRRRASHGHVPIKGKWEVLTIPQYDKL